VSLLSSFSRESRSRGAVGTSLGKGGFIVESRSFFPESSILQGRPGVTVVYDWEISPFLEACSPTSDRPWTFAGFAGNDDEWIIFK